MVCKGRFGSRKGALVLACSFLAAALFIFEISDLDLWLQDFLYSPDRGEWLVSKQAKVPRVLFYHAPKVALIAFAVWLVFSLIVPRSWKTRKWLSARPSCELIYLLLCLGLFPATINAIKKASGIHCPSELSRYSGDHPYRKVFSQRPEDPRELGRCFPAGHASGGFALLGLYFVARTERAKKAGLALGLSAGWLMGIYQMLVGAHFLSHTVITMILAWIFTLSFALMLRVPRSSATS
jgi:membrane-associated PAP2 superfamily phosphatase